MRPRALLPALLLSVVCAACAAQQPAALQSAQHPAVSVWSAAGNLQPAPNGASPSAGSSNAADDDAASGQKIGAVLQCERFSGADVSIKERACNEAAIAAGGGTIDLRTLLAGKTTGSEQMEVDTRAGNRHNIGVTALFPTSGTYTTTMVGGPAIKATVYKGSGGSGYTTGCTVVPSETGFAFTGTAKGAVFNVTEANGVVKGLTLVSAGSGYLTSKYIAAANGTCTGSGLIVNLQVADCGLRLNGSGTIETGSVGAGATTFQIVPSRDHTGFVVDSLFCTDEEGGYVRQEGGLKGTNMSPGAMAVAASAHIRPVVDHAQFNLLESTTMHDDGVRIDGACCGANFYSLHSNNGNTPGAGYPIVIGAGGVIQNACTTRGSDIITAPYAHFTAIYLGDTVSAGVKGGSSNFPPGPLIITRINSLTSITVSAKATGTNSDNPTCRTPALTGGTGLTLRLSDFSVGASTQVSFYHPVSNGPPPGLQNILITGSVAGLSMLGAYVESNAGPDDYTSQVYIGYPAAAVNFYNLFVPGPQHRGTKYGIESDTPAGWCMLGGVSFTGLLDQGVLVPPPANGNMMYCKGGFPGVVNSTANALRVLAGACTGAAPSGATNLAIYPFGTSSPSCSSTLNPQFGALMPTSGTVSGIAVRCGSTGSRSSSGAFTIVDFPNGGGGPRPTGVSVTYGTTPAQTVVRDTTHSYAYAAGDLLVVQYATSPGETLANCSASFVY
jgi:hypothetical protein